MSDFANVTVPELRLQVDSGDAPPRRIRNRVTQQSRPCANCGELVHRRPGARGRISAHCERCR